MQIIKSAELQLQNFMVLGGFFQMVPETEKSKLDLAKLQVSMEFEVLENEEDGVLIRLNTECNSGSKPKPGYSFAFMVQAEFKIPREVENRNKLIHFSALPMVVNQLRGYITSVTLQGIYGPYLLPTIDVNDLIQKQKQVKEKKKSKT